MSYILYSWIGKQRWKGGDSPTLISKFNVVYSYPQKQTNNKIPNIILGDLKCDPEKE